MLMTKEILESNVLNVLRSWNPLAGYASAAFMTKQARYVAFKSNYVKSLHAHRDEQTLHLKSCMTLSTPKGNPVHYGPAGMSVPTVLELQSPHELQELLELQYG